MSASDFLLLGHNSPLGQYPAPVVPVGTLKNELVAVFATKDGSEIAVLSNDCTYVKHNAVQQRRLLEFDLKKHRLFALREEEVLLYLIEHERDFFLSLLNTSQFASNNPFLRLSLAKATQNASAIANELLPCAKEIARRVPHYLSTWIDEEKRSIFRELDTGDTQVLIDQIESLYSIEPGPSTGPTLAASRRTWREGVEQLVSQPSKWIDAPSRRTWLIPGLVALILFVGGVASNLVASDLERLIGPYGRWAVWMVFVIALVVTVIVAIAHSHRNHEPVANSAAEKTQIVNASGERSVAIGGKIERSTIITGDESVGGNKIGGDHIARDKIIYVNQPASSAVNSLHQLRAPVGDFVGRGQEIETLITALRHGSRACITGINGMGGIGKTELALFVAEQLKGDYPDAQLFINLQGTDANPRTAEEVLAICLRAFLGPEAKLPEDRDQLLQRYRSELSGKRVLLLLDNAADSGQVQPLLPPPGSAVLVTSRQALTLPGMTRLTLNPLTDKEAQALLLEIAPRAEPAADQICVLCGYLPLAIRAAGSLLAITADLNPVDYAAQLKDERKRLERIGTEGVEIDVVASFNLSYERLAPEAARVFRLLSVFPGTFDALAEESICADAGHAQLSDLVRRSLVLYDSSTKRYRLHDLARLFANSKLSDEECTPALKRYATHYRDVLTAANELFKKGGEALALGLTLFELEWSNIQAGHAWVAAQDFEVDQDMAQLGMTYPNVGAYVLNLRLHAREQIHWLEVALTAARELKDRPGEGAALGYLGIAYKDVGDIQRAIQFHEKHLTIERELGNRGGEGNALGNLGNAYHELGEIQRAIQFHEQSLTIARELGDRRGEGNSLGNLGVAYKNLGETQRSIQFHEQHLTITRELGDRRGEGGALGNLGNAYRTLGETQLAIQFFEQALLIARELGDRRSEGTGLWNLSLALDQLGQRAQALQHAYQSLAIYEQVEDPRAARVRAKLAAWREESVTTRQHQREI